jgi:hypothetical protein
MPQFQRHVDLTLLALHISPSAELACMFTQSCRCSSTFLAYNIQRQVDWRTTSVYFRT